jgi:hypothetical protein
VEPQHHHARGVTELGVGKPATVREVETAFRALLFDAWYAEGMAQGLLGTLPRAATRVSQVVTLR